MPKHSGDDDAVEPAAARERAKPYAQGQAGRVQFSACGACRHRRVKCDLKDKLAGLPGVDPTTVQCSNCEERRMNCVDEYAQTKAKQLRKGRRLQEAKARYGERSVVHIPAELQLHQQAAIPRLHPSFFASRFFGRFQIQRPVLHPQEFSQRYIQWIEGDDELEKEAQLIGMVLVAWAASYGVDEAGNPEPHLGDESVNRRRERTNAMMREILHLVDVYGILRRPSWDGVRVLLLLMPLTEDVSDQLERLTMYEAAVAQVYTLCRIADVHTIRSGQGEATNHYVRARIFWYAHVHEGITTGLKGGRLILQQEDIDAFNKEGGPEGNAQSLVHSLGASSRDRFALRFATTPIRIAAACRKIHTALTGPRARGNLEVDRAKLDDAWEALDTSYEELETLVRDIPALGHLSTEDVSRFAHGWKIFIYECQNRIWEGLLDKVQQLKEQLPISHIEEVDDAGRARDISYKDICRRTELLAEIAHSKCSNLARDVAALVKQYLGSTFFEYDASLVRDGSFFAGYLLVDEPGCEEQVKDCMRAMDEMRWAFSKSQQYREDLVMKCDARAQNNRAAQLAAARAGAGASPPSDSDTYCNSQHSSFPEYAYTNPQDQYARSPGSSSGGSSGSATRSAHSQSPKGMPLVAHQQQQQARAHHHLAPVAPVANLPLVAQQLQPSIPMHLPLGAPGVTYQPAQLPYPLQAALPAAAAPQSASSRSASITIPPQAVTSRNASSTSLVSPPSTISPARAAPSAAGDTTQQMYFLQQQGRQLLEQQQQTVAMFQQLQQPSVQQLYHQLPARPSSQSRTSVPLVNPYGPQPVPLAQEHYPHQQPQYALHAQQPQADVPRDYEAQQPATTYYYDMSSLQPVQPGQYQAVDEAPILHNQQDAGLAATYYDPKPIDYASSQYFYPPDNQRQAAAQQPDFQQMYQYQAPQ